MRFLLAFLVSVLSASFAFAQDGSNMNYVKPSELNESYIGKFAHLDFGTRSFARHDQSRSLDTIKIKLNGKEHLFREHRVDDGYNNWFEDQYLEATEKVGGLTLRLTKNVILGISGDSIRVKSYFDYFDSKDEIVTQKWFTKELEFEKSKLFEILIKAS